jgi:hypothetical protein
LPGSLLRPIGTMTETNQATRWATPWPALET